MNSPRRFLVVFDLDGTLVDSAQDLADSGNALLRSYGAPPVPSADVIAMVGDGARELVSRLLEAAKVCVPVNHALARFLALYDARLTATTRPYDGVTEMLAAVAERARLAILTNKPERSTLKMLDALNLRQPFADVIGGDGKWARKPDPEGLRALMIRAALGPGQTLMVGDSPADLHAAVGAGVPMCLVRYGFGFAKVSPEDRALAAHEVDHPSGVAAAVARVTATL